jgi:nitrogen fixation protein FixH
MKTLIVLTSVVVMIVVVATVWLGITTFEGIVVQDPYEEGLRWDAIRRERRESGWTVALTDRRAHRGRNDIIVQVVDRSGRPLREAAVDLKLFRPASDRADRTARAHLEKDGLFHGDLELPLVGRWLAEIVVQTPNRTIVFDDELTVE